MKSKALAISLLAVTTITGYSNTSFAEPACLEEVEVGVTAYSVEGSIRTENITDTLQIGDINLTVKNGVGEVVFTEEFGSVVGNITGTDSYGATLLSHVARFSKGNSFVTNDDRAVLTEPYVRATEGEVPCSFWIQETISNISLGTRFFRQFTGIEVIADGYVSNCSSDNENNFVLSGCLYVE